MREGSFTAEIAATRKRARQKMGEGPVTSSYGNSPEDVISVLNEVVATEIGCWMRHTADEEEHADDLVDLGGRRGHGLGPVLTPSMIAHFTRTVEVLLP